MSSHVQVLSENWYRADVEMFPPFQLDDPSGGTVTEHDLVGHPSVVYLGRHPG